MAKKVTQDQANQARDELGLERNEVPVQRRAPAPRAAAGPSAAQIQAGRVAEETGPDHTLWDETKAAFRVDNTVGRLMSKEEQNYPIDLGYESSAFLKDNMDRINALNGGDRDEIAEELGSAWSYDHADSRLRQMERDYEDEMMLAAGGGSAFALRMTAALLDPVDMALALATGGTVGAMTKAGRMGRIVQTGMAAGVAGAGTEALLSQDNVMRDETDVAFAALAGIALGGALGSLSKGANADLHKLANEVAEGNLDAAAARLTGDSVGAARRTLESLEPNRPLFKDSDEMLAEVEAPEFKYKTMNNMLFNLQSRLFYNASDKVKKVASSMFEGGFLKNKGKTRALTVENQATMLDAVFQRNVYAETLDGFKTWSKRKGYGNVRREMSTGVGEEFYSEVGIAMRGLTDGVSPEAIAAAGKIRKHMDNVYDTASKAGLKGFNRGGLEDYFPRVMNKAKFAEMRAKVGDDALEEFYFDAIMKGDNGLTDSIGRKIARAYMRTMREKGAGIENDLMHGIRLDDIDRLRSQFKGDPDVEELISELEALKVSAEGQRGTVSHAKRRITFDESHADQIRGSDGTAFELKFTDLYENDARLVLTRYSRAMHGHIAMADKMGVKSRGDFERLTKEMGSEVESLGGDAAKMEQDFRDGFDLLLGQPIDRWNPNGDAAQMSRMFSAYNYGGRGGQFGVNALAELGNVVAQGGLGAAFRVFPDLFKVMKRAQNGDLEHNLARFVELNFAPGVHTLINPAIRNLDELAEGFGGTTVISKFAAKMDPYLKSLGRGTSISSGLAPITDATQRLSAIRHVERLAKFAKRKPGKKQVERLRAAGLNDAMQERVFEMMRTAGKYRKGRLVDIDMEKWTDSGALKAFSESSNRVTRDAIQMPDISTSTMLFNHPAGRLIFQFMRFPMDAVNKQLARHIHHADGESISAAVSSFGIASAVYMAQQSIEFANNPEELKKRLAPEQIAKIGFMRTGYSSMLPGMFDAALWAGGVDPWFAMGRSSGLSTFVPVEQNPTGTLLKNAVTFAGGVTRSALQDDVQFSQGDMRAGLQVLPFYRALGAKNAWHAIEQQFPESRKQE